MGNHFLVDESLSPFLVRKLQEFYYSAKSVRDIKLNGAPDAEIVEWAIKNHAGVITGDLDFGELWYWSYRGKLGIIVLRVKDYTLESQSAVIAFLHQEKVLRDDTIKNALIISTAYRYRIRKG